MLARNVSGITVSVAQRVEILTKIMFEMKSVCFSLPQRLGERVTSK